MVAENEHGTVEQVIPFEVVEADDVRHVLNKKIVTTESIIAGYKGADNSLARHEKAKAEEAKNKRESSFFSYLL